MLAACRNRKALGRRLLILAIALRCVNILVTAAVGTEAGFGTSELLQLFGLIGGLAIEIAIYLALFGGEEAAR